MSIKNGVKFLQNGAFRAIFVIAMLLVFMVVGSSVSNLFAMEEKHPAMTSEKQVPDIEHPIKNGKILETTVMMEKNYVYYYMMKVVNGSDLIIF